MTLPLSGWNLSSLWRHIESRCCIRSLSRGRLRVWYDSVLLQVSVAWNSKRDSTGRSVCGFLDRRCSCSSLESSCVQSLMSFSKRKERKKGKEEWLTTYIKKKHRGRNLRLKSVPFCCSGIWEDLVAQERAVSNFGQILGHFWGGS